MSLGGQWTRGDGPPRAGGKAAAALPCLALGWWEAGQPVEMGSWLQQEGRGTVTTMIAPMLSQPMWGTLHLRLHLLFWTGKRSHPSSQKGSLSAAGWRSSAQEPMVLVTNHPASQREAQKIWEGS